MEKSSCLKEVCDYRKGFKTVEVLLLNSILLPQRCPFLSLWAEK